MKRTTMKIMIAIFAVASAVIPLLSQTATPAKKPSFEVVSIKRNLSVQQGGGGGPRGDRFVLTNMTLRQLLNFAYRPQKGNLLNQQIIGGPDWTNTDRFDIEAKSGGTPPIPYDQIQLMVQSLLEDRFQLKAHREMRDLPVYNLVVAKGGLKMKLSADQTAPDPRQGFIAFATSEEEDPKPLPRGAMRQTRGSSDTILSGNALSVTNLVNNLLQGASDRIIMDKTSLTGLFDIHIRFHTNTAPETLRTDGAPAPSDASTPSIFTAIQDLGLRLESGKAPLEVVVIDSVQQPSEN